MVAESTTAQHVAVALLVAGEAIAGHRVVVHVAWRSGSRSSRSPRPRRRARGRSARSCACPPAGPAGRGTPATTVSISPVAMASASCSGVTWTRSWRAAWTPFGSVMAQDGKPPACPAGPPGQAPFLAAPVASLGGRSTPLARASSRYCSAASALTFSAGAISRHEVDAGPLVHRALGRGQRGVPVAGGEVPDDLGHLVHVARLQLLLVVLEAAGPVGGHAGIGLATAPTPGPRARRPRRAAARRPPRSCRAAPTASSRR